jgi:hypothetical protein
VSSYQHKPLSSNPGQDRKSYALVHQRIDRVPDQERDGSIRDEPERKGVVLLRLFFVIGQVLLFVFEGEIVGEVEGPESGVLVGEDLEVDDLVRNERGKGCEWEGRKGGEGQMELTREG